jgi:hypothetical protein
MRSMKMPVRMALATERKEGRGSPSARLCVASCFAKVDASHLRTSAGTASDCSSERSSSASSLRSQTH